MNSKVDAYLADGCGRCALGGTPQCKVHNWPNELAYLRSLVMECGLTEELKWGVPCYTFQNANILIVSAFKEYAALSFFKGALLNDSYKILVKPGENTQLPRLIKFSTLQEIIGLETILKTYIFEAIDVERTGIKPVIDKVEAQIVPDEFQKELDNNIGLKTAFEALTLGKQRAYMLYFAAPMQLKTRMERVKKYTEQILQGLGLHDKYNC